MAINHKLLIGQVNLTGYLHVTIAKMATPATVVWDTYIPLPFTNHTLIIPVPDPDVYYLNFYESPDNVSLGVLRSQAFFSALSPQYTTEVRFYEIGNLPAGATLDATERIINDPYLVGKTVESYFKEGFRFLEPTAEIDFDDTTGDMTLLTGGTFEPQEKFTITIKYSVGNIPASTNGGLYTGILNITAATYTLLPGDRNKLVRLLGSAATQVLTMPALIALSVDDGYYFDNSCGGTAVQVKILMNGGDRIRYNGFMESTNEYAEFWVSKGQHLLIKKFDDDYAEIRTDFKGVCVGEQVTVGYKAHPLIISENGQLMDGDEWPLMWYWLKNILPVDHKYETASVTGSFVADVTKPGQFALHPTLKKFRMPSTGGLMQKGLKDFESYGADTANRPVDYPGGYQAEMVGPHTHPNVPMKFNDVDRGGGSSKYSIDTDGNTGTNNGSENRVKNTAVIHGRRMG